MVHTLAQRPLAQPAPFFGAAVVNAARSPEYARDRRSSEE